MGSGELQRSNGKSYPVNRFRYDNIWEGSSAKKAAIDIAHAAEGCSLLATGVSLFRI